AGQGARGTVVRHGPGSLGEGITTGRSDHAGPGQPSAGPAGADPQPSLRSTGGTAAGCPSAVGRGTSLGGDPGVPGGTGGRGGLHDPFPESAVPVAAARPARSTRRTRGRRVAPRWHTGDPLPRRVPEIPGDRRTTDEAACACAREGSPILWRSEEAC